MSSVPPSGLARWRWRDWPWAAKLLLVLGTLSLAPLLALTLYNAAAARSEVLAATRVQNLQQARNTALILDHLLEKIVADLRTVAVAPGSVRFLSGTPRIEPQVVMERWLRQTREIQGFDALYIVDSDGTVLLATDPRLAGRNVVSARSFQNAMAGNTGFDGPRYDLEDGRIHLYVSGPVRNSEDRTLGAVVGRVRMSEIDTVIQADTGFAGRGEFGILWDAEGIRLSHPARPYLRFRPFEPLAPDVVSRRIVEQRFGPDTSRLLAVDRPVFGIVNHSKWLLYDSATSPYIRLEVPGGSALQGAIVPLQSNRWLYGLFSPEAAVLPSIRKQTQRNVLAAAFTALLAAVLASVAARWIVRPLRRVGQAADAVARGDLTRRVGLRQRDEVGQLAAAFDAMADSLAAKDLELRRYAGRLEQRVAEQTAELRGLVAREQEARRKAEEANRIKDEFLSTVSHELRTPLNAILSWVWLLAGGKLGPEETRRALASIERNARAQGQIVEDLLDVSRIITGKLRLQTVPVDLIQIVAAALDSVRPAADAKGIRVERKLDPAAALVIGDPNRLQQVIWNLLSNAVKFTPQDGTVEVCLARRDGRAEIQVRDDGIGISPDFLDHVFDRFRQADSSTTRSHGGLGLGLAIVRHLVELHGGTVEAASDGEGRGALFTVRLPVAPGLQEELEPPAAAPEPSLELYGVKVLVVDDEPGAREVLPAVLERFGANVQVSASAPEALETLRHFAPDVLVSDIAMPGEDGYSLIGKIRALEGDSGRIPAIALTAYAGDADRRRALEAGFQLHLAKPIEPRDLVTAVASMAREAVRER